MNSEHLQILRAGHERAWLELPESLRHDLITAADEALYQASNTGLNRVPNDAQDLAIYIAGMAVYWTRIASMR